MCIRDRCNPFPLLRVDQDKFVLYVADLNRYAIFDTRNKAEKWFKDFVDHKYAQVAEKQKEENNRKWYEFWKK